MKKFKKSIAVIMVAVMLFTSMGMFTLNTQALVPEYNGESDTIYYFTDYYPTVDANKMEELYPDYNIIYDHKWVNSQTFDIMVDSGYFNGLELECIVIIDIKTFKPDTITLDTLFATLKDIMGCYTVFITPYTASDFSGQWFMGIIDVFYTTNLSILDSFVEFFVNDIFPYPNSVANTTILIDRRLIDVNALNQNNINSLYTNYPFFRILIEKLATRLNHSGADYEAIRNILDYLNVKIIVDAGNGEYVDIISWTTYEADTFSDFSSYDDVPLNNVYGFGFWALETDFCYFLEEGQWLLMGLPVYVLEVEPIIEGEGLAVISHRGAGSGVIDTTEQDLFLEEFNDFLATLG